MNKKIERLNKDMEEILKAEDEKFFPGSLDLMFSESHKLKKIKKTLSKISDEIDVLLEAKDEQKARAISEKMLMKAEMSFYDLREILIETISKIARKKPIEPNSIWRTEAKEKELLQSMKGQFDFINYGGLFYFRLPELATTRGINGSWEALFIDKFIEKEVEKIVQENILKKGIQPIKGQFTVVFVHHYTSYKDMRDVDNYAIKRPIDGLHPFLIPDDSPEVMSLFQFGMKDKEKYTDMIVLPGTDLRQAFYYLVGVGSGKGINEVEK